jgi:hypothetical protein
MRKPVQKAIFITGLFGLCLFVFGGIPDALAVLGVWLVTAWLYNR